MSATSEEALAKERILCAYKEQYAALTELFAQLTPGEWRIPTALPGWDVQAVAAHIMGTELMLLGDNPTVSDLGEQPAHVQNEIAAANELWVRSFRDASPEQLRQRWDETVTRRSDAMDAMSDEEWHADSWTPVGQGTYSRFMRIRVYDCWLHEQDIRDAVDRPGHETGGAVEVALDEIATGLGYIVGRKAGAPDGSSVTIRLTGPVEREFHVAVEGRAKPVDTLTDPATTLDMPTGTYVRLTGGRGTVDDLIQNVTVGVDHELGMQIARNMAFTI